MNVLAHIKRNEFFKHNAIFFIGSVLVGALNYLYYPVLGRLMSPAHFGEVQTLVSLFLQFTIFLNVLSMVAITILANYKDQKKAQLVIFELEKFAVYIAAALLIISVLAGEFLKQQLQFNSASPFAALALAFLISVPLTFRSAYARSQKRFGVASASQLIGAFVKIIFSAGLVALGLGTLGAIGGIIVAQLVALIYATIWAKKLGFMSSSPKHYKQKLALSRIMPELPYAATVFIGLLAITLAMSIDVIIVKYFFDAHTAGLYAGIATVARMIFFVAAPIALVLMPSVNLKQTEAQNYSLLVKSLALTIIVSVPILAVCILWPSTVTSLLMGAEYSKYADALLPVLATAIFTISIANLLCMFYLSLRKKALAIISALGFLLSLTLMICYHTNLEAIVYAVLAGGIFMIIISVVYIIISFLKGNQTHVTDNLNRDTNL